MAYTIVNPQLGFLPLTAIDSGVTTSGGTSGGTVIPTPPLQLGRIIEANDPTYGTGEFILLAGVANTAVGSVVAYNSTSFTTVLAPAGASLPQPIAVAMSANASASTWGWYQISGVAVCTKSSASLVSGVAVGITTAGLINATASAAEVQGALVAATATTTATTVLITLNRPHMQGRIS
jgi:hypothetical protein